MEGRGVLERAENSARVPRQVTYQAKLSRSTHTLGLVAQLDRLMV
jgi:hypothetical protein